ncbi:MAG TPA: protease modulator HflC [Gammaproteobacteria bacterium]|nr:protease modulator HflC [Gammaproteobacteria bacterium]
MNPLRSLLLILAFVILGWSCTFVVTERQQALLLNFGSIIGSDYAPGLHFKWPWNQVRRVERRILSLDAGEPERFLTNEKKDVIVDSYVRWRIVDVEKYYRATQGDENRAGQLLYQAINSKLREEFGKRSVQQVVSGERGEIMNIVTQTVDSTTGSDLGIKIEDVRIKRIDLPAEVSGSVYGRMRAERDRVARDFRSRGAEAAERVRADADRERTVILADAYRDAERVRGEGDARATEIYAEAYGADREFYDFYRSLNAYKNSFSGKNNMLLLSPDSQFLKYFNSDKPPAP